MAFSNEQAPSDTPSAARLDNAQQAVAQARRRLLGAAMLLALACALIPWLLDSTPRAWGDDVILRMPKNEQPYQAKPDTKSAANAATAGAAVSKPTTELKP